MHSLNCYCSYGSSFTLRLKKKYFSSFILQTTYLKKFQTIKVRKYRKWAYCLDKQWCYSCKCKHCSVCRHFQPIFKYFLNLECKKLISGPLWLPRWVGEGGGGKAVPERGEICIHVADWLHCAAEANTIL